MVRASLFAAFALLAPVLACEYYIQPQQASNGGGGSGASTATTEAAPVAPRSEAAGPAQHAAPEAASARPVASAGPTRELLAGGELRVECPLGYHAQASKELGCACTSENGTVAAATSEASGAEQCQNGRAEGDECIFTCPDPNAPSDKTSANK
jgi:hypothetical protein